MKNAVKVFLLKMVTFNELYEKLSNVYSLMTAFIALNFVQMAFNYVGLCCLGCFAPALDKEDY